MRVSGVNLSVTVNEQGDFVAQI
ncbi:hypothetical protein SCB49_09185 [unidentified eubacterium SCB49]|nr:hypothetical protein SCB49_09185 [unidentified eubacterium SCB49]